MSNHPISADLQYLLFQSKLRWLRTNEIFTLLLSISSSGLNAMAINELPFQPQSGDIFIISGDTQNKKWKNDGYIYLTRKTGIGFREDIERLKVAGVKEIVCYYSYVVQPNFTGVTSEIIMNRRIYKLINNMKPENNYFLVHYLKEASASSTSQSNKLSSSSEFTEGKTTQETRSFPPLSPFDFSESPLGDKNGEIGDGDRKKVVVSERDFIGMAMEGQGQAQNFDFCQGDMDFEDRSEIKFQDPIENKPSFLSPSYLNPNQNDSGNYQALQNRIMELEARIHDLEFEKHSVSIQNNTNSTVSNSQTCAFSEYKIKINDFSPEWDFVEGGSKMMVCFSPNLMIPTEDQNNKLCVMFGNVESRAFCIQPGVLKCYVPPHVKGFVKLSLLFNKDRIDDNLDKSSMFEYRKAHSNKRKTPKIDELVLEKEDTKKISHDFKVRIIEKLSNFHQSLTKNTNFEQSNKEKQWKIEEICGVLKEFQENSENFDMAAFNGIFTTMMKKAEEVNFSREAIAEFLNELNSDGFALIHYLMLINFYDTIPLLTKYNIDLNISSKGGITPLQIAIAFNYERAVEMLIKHGVISSNNMANNQSNNLLKQNLANLDVLFKNSHIFDMIMREVTLQDSINNSNSVHTEKFSCNNQDDQEEENFFNILDLMNDMEDKLMINSDEETKNKRKEEKNIDFHLLENGEKSNNHFETKKHKYLKFHSKKNKKENKKKDFQGQNIGNELKNKEIYSVHQEHIKTIQKNVRGWLLRRQYLDIKYAARVLQNYIRGKLAKKQMSPEYKMLIKNKLKDWLNLKC